MGKIEMRCVYLCVKRAYYALDNERRRRINDNKEEKKNDDEMKQNRIEKKKI